MFIDGIQPNLPQTDAEPIDPDRVDEETIKSRMQLWQGSTEANSQDREDILATMAGICNPQEITKSGLYNLSERKATPIDGLSIEDPVQRQHPSDHGGRSSKRS